MICNEEELNVALERLEKVQREVAQLRTIERDPDRYHLSVSGFLSQIGRIQEEVRQYLRAAATPKTSAVPKPLSLQESPF